MKREALVNRYKKNKEGKDKSSTQRKKRKFKPEIGKEYKVRILPWNPEDSQEDWNPFEDTFFYFGIVRYGLPTLAQYGKDDPVQETINELLESGVSTKDPEVKRLYPKKRTFSPVVVQGQEEKGVQYWEYGSQVENQLLAIIVNEEEYGDVLDFEEGRWMNVSVTKTDTQTWPETTVQPGGRPLPLTKSKKTLKEWLADYPDLSEDYAEVPYKEMSTLLDRFLGADEEEEEESEPKEEKRQRAAKNAGSSNDKVEEADDDDDDDEDVESAFAGLVDDED